jgi:hypothetical protein
MDYELNAKPGVFTADIHAIPKDPKQRILDCENEITEVLRKHNCILTIRVAARAEETDK